jgi:hypothetical protein
MLALIAPNKNGQPPCKKLDAMIWATNPQLPKYVVKAITSTKTRPIPLLKMTRKNC